MKTKEKCLHYCKVSMHQSKRIVIDNTNPSKERRKEYIDIAKEFGYKIRCFHFKIDEMLALHLNSFREVVGLKERVPTIGYSSYKKHFEEPRLNEGIDEIVEIDYDYDAFLIPEIHKKSFEQFLF